MKELQSRLKTKTLVLTHGDSDGICSGAIAKTAYPDAYVYFTSPVNLLEKLRLIEDVRNLIICDIAIDERNCSELYTMLCRFAKKCNLYYIDHHPLPKSCIKESWFYHESEACSSELTYRLFEKRLNRDMRRVAIYGAIGDFCDNTEHVKSWIKDWDKRNLYFQAGTLTQAILYKGKEYEFKRSLIEPLSKDIIPSNVPELLELAREAAINEEKIRLFVKENVKTLRNCAYIVNSNNSISKAAIYAASYGRRNVGIAAEYRERKEAYDLSIRSRGEVDVNRILRSVAPKFGGSGGGHPLAAGARIPENSLYIFLRAFDKELGEANEAEDNGNK
ncbi:RecJ-like exonuclease [Methanosarcina thermophila]|jgi:single-stranded-DNA-specific exonuclease|uniref:Phosphoesterase n=3 Tax=Methanosarcina thermophila TaxID=2210 RepID=A0A1I6Y1E4_METTE|nr:DHHA1 domain-containing protein [Methanosarcina thermophila]ALK05817.1 MAG: phosphoesterase [Methanosarcina sp. 795]AKB12704.1 Phosphoesterase [Methanosarcina thermophila TM-1]AKB16678.1 Phosphoesterase [Methanosarcina thermophila CHTI-55]NLU57704.1 DHH family phosphoesterase [Methanosarcina thermophila]SFT44132.1 RecJ-like exonuclease [Methanosarcina thermophila]